MSTNDTPIQDDCEVNKITDIWSDPHLEYDHRGELTGSKYFRCRNCGREVLEGIDKDNVSHRDGCRFGEGNDENDEDDRDAPRRSEPADFGGGETTGVQDL